MPSKENKNKTILTFTEGVSIKPKEIKKWRRRRGVLGLKQRVCSLTSPNEARTYSIYSADILVTSLVAGFGGSNRGPNLY